MKSEPTFSEITPNVDGSAAELAHSLFSHSGQRFETRASRIADAHADVLEFLSDRISTLEQDTDIATLRDAMLYFGNKLALFSREARDDKLKSDAKIEAIAGIVEALTARSHTTQSDRKRQDADLYNRFTQTSEQIDAVGQKANALESIVKKAASREASVIAQVDALKDSLEQTYKSLEAERKISATLAERLRSIEQGIANWNSIEGKIDTMLQRVKDLDKMEDELSRINREKVHTDAALRSISHELNSTSVAAANSNEQYSRARERLTSVEGELASILKRDAVAANYHARLAAAYTAEKRTEE
jgi:hypothetical protein